MATKEATKIKQPYKIIGRDGDRNKVRWPDGTVEFLSDEALGKSIPDPSSVERVKQAVDTALSEQKTQHDQVKDVLEQRVKALATEVKDLKAEVASLTAAANAKHI